MARLAAFVNFMVVKLHNAARLEHFRAAGVTHVGVVPEFREPSKPSRFLKHDHAIHDASSTQRKLAAATEAASFRMPRSNTRRRCASAHNTGRPRSTSPIFIGNSAAMAKERAYCVRGSRHHRVMQDCTMHSG
jgi:hypothetical protein